MSLVPTHGAEGGADDFEGDQLDDELIELLDELLGDGAELLIEWEQGKKKRKKPGKGPRCSVNQRRRQHTGGRPQKATAQCTTRTTNRGTTRTMTDERGDEPRLLRVECKVSSAAQGLDPFIWRIANDEKRRIDRMNKLLFKHIKYVLI